MAHDDQSRSPHNNANNTQDEENISQHLEDLRCTFMTLSEYRKKVKQGILEQKPLFADDREFDAQHPHHPLASEARFKRINAADSLRDIAEHRTQPFPQSLLDQLHTALFDCCAPVRHSIVQTLFHAGTQASLESLTHLQKIEDESRAIKQDLKAAIHTLSPQQSTTTRKQILLLSKDITIVSALLEVAEENNAHLYIGNPSAPDLIAVPHDLAIVNPAILGQNIWDSYCEYIETLRDNSTTQPGEDLPVSDNLTPDTPLIVIARQIRTIMENRTTPQKPKDSMYFIEKSLKSEILSAAECYITGKKIT